jgi:HPt (histidine-containing phosphotransfer) domain-containing protein
MKLWGVGMLVVLVLVAWVGPGSARGMEPLVHDPRTGDETTRVRAVLALGHSGDPQAVEVLRHALHDESALVRKHALEALKHLLQTLAHASRLVTHWLHELLERVEEWLEEPQVTTVRGPIETSRFAWYSEKPPPAGRQRFQEGIGHGR